MEQRRAQRECDLGEKRVMHEPRPVPTTGNTAPLPMDGLCRSAAPSPTDAVAGSAAMISGLGPSQGVDQKALENYHARHLL